MIAIIVRWATSARTMSFGIGTVTIVIWTATWIGSPRIALISVRAASPAVRALKMAVRAGSKSELRTGRRAASLLDECKEGREQEDDSEHRHRYRGQWKPFVPLYKRKVAE